MATRSNGKDAFDALIARGLDMSSSGVEFDCPDPDVLAAFAAHGLSAPEHARWEAHVAGCALCQHDVAALARTGLAIDRLGDRSAQAATIAALSEHMGVPVGAIVRYVLARYATGGSSGLLELGPSMVHRLWEPIDRAERADTASARLAAYDQVRQMIAWLRQPLLGDFGV